MEDAELIEKVRSGDKDAYAPLVRKYHTEIIRFCQGMLRNPAEADDAAQDVFIKAYHALNKFRGDAAFPTWLHSIASNHCLDLLRTRSRKKTESWDALIAEHGKKLEALLAGTPDTTNSVENADLVRRVLSTLPADHRNILILRELQNLTYGEIGQVLDCSLDTVKARLKRARKNFLEQLRHITASSHV